MASGSGSSSGSSDRKPQKGSAADGDDTEVVSLAAAREWWTLSSVLAPSDKDGFSVLAVSSAGGTKGEPAAPRSGVTLFTEPAGTSVYTMTAEEMWAAGSIQLATAGPEPSISTPPGVSAVVVRGWPGHEWTQAGIRHLLWKEETGGRKVQRFVLASDDHHTADALRAFAESLRES